MQSRVPLWLSSQAILGTVGRRFLINSQQASQLSQSVQIEIPKAIKRGPTDILKALSSTVELDSTGPHYRYMDDPYLTPANSVDKRLFSLSKESGRKAAQYFIDKYPEYFYRDISEPKIEAFTYKELYDESMEFDESDLEKCILRCDVSNAIICYNGLVGKQQHSIQTETLLDLLDLVCFYNCEDEAQRWAEEEWFSKPSRDWVQVKNTWKDGGFAEQLFQSIEPKTDRVYSALIMGMAKHGQAERAFAFYKQAIDLNMKLNVQTYNALINASYHIHQNNDDRWKVVVDLLKTMRDNQIKPNLGTLNSALKQISIYRFWEGHIEMGKRVLSEFAFKYDITPSLATYSHVLNIFYKSKHSKNSVIYEIIDRISGMQFEFCDIDDVNFFATAMDVAMNMNDIQLAYKIHGLAEKNRKFLGTSFTQNAYYNKFLKLLCASDSFENFMILYKQYVPHLYTPTIELMEEMMKNIKLYRTLEHVSQIYQDLKLFNFTTRIDLISELLSTMDELTPDDQQYMASFNEIVLDIYIKGNQRIARSYELGYQPTFQWSSKALSTMVSILVKVNNLDGAFEVIKKLNEIKNEALDYPDTAALTNFCLGALTVKQYDQALFCLEYCKEMALHDVLNAVAQQIDTLTSTASDTIKKKFEKTLKLIV